MKKRVVLAFLYASMSAAHAADISAPDDIPVINASEITQAEPVTERWGGAYIGVAIGQGYLSDTVPAKGSNTVYGGYAGYNAQWGHFVAGVEVSADNSDITFNDGSGIKAKFMYAGRVRAGWANNWMLAYTSLGAQHGVTNIPTPYSKDTALELGAGVDFAVTRHISLGANFTYAHYKKFADFPLFGGVDVDTKKVQARLSYTFN
jgi:opacity protein-like surface antigen